MKTFKLAVLAAFAFACTLTLRAQTTNLVQTLSIQLFGYAQGNVSQFGSTTISNINLVQVNSRQIIQALGVATMNSFSSTSKLVVVTPVDGSSAPAIQVRDGSNPPVDVTGFFVIQSVSDPVNGGVFNSRNQRGTGVSYEIARFGLQDNDGTPISMHFDVDGVTTITSPTPFGGGFPSPTINSNVSGSGDRNGNLLILQGSINVFGHDFEVEAFNTGVS